MAKYTDYTGNIWDQLVQTAGWTPAKVADINSSLDMFINTTRNLTGAPPTTDQVNAYMQQAILPTFQNPGTPGYSDLSNLTNDYVMNTFAPEVASHAQQQQTDQLAKTQQTVQDLIGKQTAATAADLTNPNSPTYQSFSGLMNNLGITPSSGAFQAGMGGVLGQNAANAENAALGGVTLPVLSGIQGLSGFGLQQAQGNSNLGHINQLSDFGLQEQLAQMLQNQMQPSGFEKNLGYANTASNIASNVASAGADAKSTSYVCKELIKRGLLCESDMDDFHAHIMPALFKKGRAFWKYAMDGLRLVESVNARGLDWAVFKPLLFDRVMAEPDPCKAVDLYADACCQLCFSCNYGLWDYRVMRTSFWDSLLFLPRLLTYRPFLEALGTCFRRKFAIIYDKPKCEVH